MSGATRLDVRPLVAVVLTATMLVVYIAVMYDQGDRPRAWFAGSLALGMLLAAYGTPRSAPHRRAALVVGAAVLAALGVLGLLSIGAPSWSPALCLVAGLTDGQIATPRDG